MSFEHHHPDPFTPSIIAQAHFSEYHMWILPVVIAGLVAVIMTMLRSPIFTQSLPPVTPGPHKKIGYAYVRGPPKHPHTTPWPRLKETGEPILNLEQVGYSLFYPCDEVKARHGIHWFPEPTKEMMYGYEKFVGRKGVSWLFKALQFVVGRLRFSALLNAPLNPSSSKYRLAIFSHGLAGTRHTYTQYVSGLASEGYVVLVIEHRDGSGPAVTLPGDKVLHYVKKDDLSWEKEASGSLEAFRTAQLDFRIREVHEAFESFKDLASGQVGEVDILGVDKVKSAEWTSTWKDKVDIDNIYLTGHSFGAGTVLYSLQTPPPKEYTSLPVKKAIMLDPWLEPLPRPSPTTQAPLNPPPTLIINSPGFTIWKGHFPRLVDLVLKMNGNLVTLIDSNHQSFSDFPLLAPTSPAKALVLLSRIHELSVSFLDDKLDSCPLFEGEPDNGDFERGEDGKMKADGPTVVHLKRT